MSDKIAFAVAVACAIGCGPPGLAGKPIDAEGFMFPRHKWHTLRAVQEVEVVLPDGSKHSMRALLAIERPDKFRLRALGPGGVTLFDVLSVGGKPKVIEAIKGASAGKLAAVVDGLAGDISAAYNLEPHPPDRELWAPTTRHFRPVAPAQSPTVIEPDRTVILTELRADSAGHAFPGQILVKERRTRFYTAFIRTVEVVLDEPLEPALFDSR